MLVKIVMIVRIINAGKNSYAVMLVRIVMQYNASNETNAGKDSNAVMLVKILILIRIVMQ